MRRLVVVQMGDKQYRFDFSSFNRNTVNERKRALTRKIEAVESKKVKLERSIKLVEKYKEEMKKLDDCIKEFENELLALASKTVDDEVASFEYDRETKRVSRQLLKGQIPK
jgi:hypothetical protein